MCHNSPNFLLTPCSWCCKLECMIDRIAQQSPGRRAAAYWFRDGLPEIGFGLLYLIWSLSGIRWGYDPQNPWTKAEVAAAGIAFMVFFLWDRKILNFFKARLTYPRTGYVRPPADPAPAEVDPFRPLGATPPYDQNVTHFRMGTAFLFFAAMPIVNLTATANGAPNRWSIPVVMAIVAAVEYGWNRNGARPYHWWSVAFIALAGVLSPLWELPARSRQFIPLLIGGVWLLTQGGCTLIGYLRANPRARSLENART
jgi:hypothetical protein